MLKFIFINRSLIHDIFNYNEICLRIRKFFDINVFTIEKIKDSVSILIMNITYMHILENILSINLYIFIDQSTYTDIYIYKYIYIYI